jgi:hypothetical protein
VEREIASYSRIACGKNSRIAASTTADFCFNRSELPGGAEVMLTQSAESAEFRNLSQVVNTLLSKARFPGLAA